MKVILKEDVVGLGDIGESVKVRPGYARNFLIPRGMAFEADTASAKQVAHKMLGVEAKKKKLKGAAADIAQRVRDVVIELELRVGAGGRVFGSVSSRDIAAKLAEAGFEIDRRRIVLHESIKKIGTHFVKIKLHPEVESQLKIVINERAATKEEEETEAAHVKETIEAASSAKRSVEETPATE